LIAVLSHELCSLPPDWVESESLPSDPASVDWLIVLGSDRLWTEQTIERCLQSDISPGQLVVGGPAEAEWLDRLRQQIGCKTLVWSRTTDSTALASAVLSIEREAAAEQLDHEVKSAMETGALALLGAAAPAIELAHMAFAVAATLSLGLRPTERVIRLALYLELSLNPEAETIVQCSRNLWPIRSLLQRERSDREGEQTLVPIPPELAIVRAASLARSSDDFAGFEAAAALALSRTTPSDREKISEAIRLCFFSGGKARSKERKRA
jgi:hypothetical protein